MAKDKITEHVASLATARDFKGEIGEHHRVFFGSVDLLAEDAGDAPWKDGVKWTESMDTMVQAILVPNGSADVAVVFDGGSLEARRKIEEAFEKAEWRHTTQVTIAYTSHRHCGGRAWKQVFGTNPLESCCLASRFRSNKWKVVPRKLYGVGADASSQSAMYVDVPVRPMASLPTMSKNERLAMTGAKECRSPAARIFDVQLKGHPLSWTEQKTHELVRRLLGGD